MSGASRMAADGVGRFVEVGPGKVLCGLCRCIAPGSEIHRTLDLRRVRLTLDALPVPARQG
ncbi:hypothetical protein QNO07_20925 [Streptomyces sp. 549]|uniref:hypothetical protein n=1 Tax=Streptomyces sp. 549 TaxID=3049076 RepID=UPI0024C2E82D|nr:hypothetical protein [Streptomyces sp. 549]MDK1475850.1 hypothetical protein [Streptomyces sp. 549]